jgi:nickel/cobalt transporter (NiCoT) family protein
MHSMPDDWLGLMLLVLILGLKHGMDPDHLATIDGLTRFNAARRPRLSRWSGFLFSLGHGAVVTLVAGVVAAMAGEWSAPGWLEDLGAWISILFLLALGGVNLRAVFRAAPGELVRTAGIKGRWLGRLTEAGHPVVIAAIGAAFALSFDTISQAAVFSLTASHLVGWVYATALGLVFMLGMMVTDGVNGLWVARLLRRADRQALIASRVLGIAIGLLSVLIAGFGIAKYLLGDLGAFADRAGMFMGVGVVGVLLASFALAMRMSRPWST